MPKINVYLPDDLAERVKALGISPSPVCQAALRFAVINQQRLATAPDMEEITVQNKNGAARFIGRWIVVPDRDETRARRADGPQWDPEVYYGIAVTRRRQIALWTCHANERFEPELRVVPHAAHLRGVIPESLVRTAEYALGPSEPEFLDI